MKNECKGIYGELFGHKYVTVYRQHKKPVLPNDVFGAITAMKPLFETKTIPVKTYCKRCGKVIEH